MRSSMPRGAPTMASPGGRPWPGAKPSQGASLRRPGLDRCSRLPEPEPGGRRLDGRGRLQRQRRGRRPPRLRRPGERLRAPPDGGQARVHRRGGGPGRDDRRPATGRRRMGPVDGPDHARPEQQLLVNGQLAAEGALRPLGKPEGGPGDRGRSRRRCSADPSRPGSWGSSSRSGSTAASPLRRSAIEALGPRWPRGGLPKCLATFPSGQARAIRAGKHGLWWSVRPVRGRQVGTFGAGWASSLPSLWSDSDGLLSRMMCGSHFRRSMRCGPMRGGLPQSSRKVTILLRFRFDGEDAGGTAGRPHMGAGPDRERGSAGLTRPQQVEFLRLVHDGLGRLMACSQMKLNERNLRRALAQSPSFRRALEHVEQMRSENLFSILYAAALAATRRPRDSCSRGTTGRSEPSAIASGREGSGSAARAAPSRPGSMVSSVRGRIDSARRNRDMRTCSMRLSRIAKGWESAMIPSPHSSQFLPQTSLGLHAAAHGGNAEVVRVGAVPRAEMGGKPGGTPPGVPWRPAPRCGRWIHSPAAVYASVRHPSVVSPGMSPARSRRGPTNPGRRTHANGFSVAPRARNGSRIIAAGSAFSRRPIVIVGHVSRKQRPEKMAGQRRARATNRAKRRWPTSTVAPVTLIARRRVGADARASNGSGVGWTRLLSWTRTPRVADEEALAAGDFQVVDRLDSGRPRRPRRGPRRRGCAGCRRASGRGP